MEQKLDINDFYMTEYVCSGCGNICSRKDATCPVCGELRIGKTTVTTLHMKNCQCVLFVEAGYITVTL